MWPTDLMCMQYKVDHVLIALEQSIKIHGSFPLLRDHSRSNIAKVDPRSAGTQDRRSKSIP